MRRVKKVFAQILIFVLVISTLPLDFSLKAYAAEGLPIVEKGIDEESDVIRISRNGSTFTGFNVMYSTTELAKSTWKSFVALGKERTDINGNSGYKNLKLAAGEETLEYKCKQAGYYTFCICEQYFTVQVEEGDIHAEDPVPEEPDPVDPAPEEDPAIISREGNIITITRVASDITGVTAMYSTVAPEKETWVSFYTTGKLRTDINGAKGYIGYKFNAEGKINYTCKYAGTYYFWINEKLYSESVGDEDIPEEPELPEDPITPPDGEDQVLFTQDGDIITINKNGTEETSVLWMMADAAPAKETWYSFYSTGKNKPEINTSKGYQTKKLTSESVEFVCSYAGTYYFWSKNKLYSFTVTEEQLTHGDPEDPTPTAEVSYTKNGNIIHIDENGTGLNSVYVMFSQTPPAKETWYSYYTTGKTNTQINGKNGYKTLEFREGSYDYKCCYPGTYYFWSQDKLYSFAVTEGEIPDEDEKDIPGILPDPILEPNGKEIHITKNNSGVTKAFYMFSEEEPASLTWNSFVSNGKHYVTVNSDAGYRSLELADEETIYTGEYVGWYSFWINEKMYKFQVGEDCFTEEDPALEVPEDPVPEVKNPIITKNGNTVTIQKDEAVFDNVLVMYADREVDRNTWTTFYTVGKEHPDVNTASGYRTVRANSDTISETYFRAGHYYYWINNVEYHVELTSTDVPEHRYAVITAQGKTFTVAENDADVTYIRYTCTEEEPEYTGEEFSMEELAVLGKEDKDTNSELGYIEVSGPYDGKKITVRRSGYYTFAISDASGVHSYVFEVSPEEIGSFGEASASLNNNVIRISENDSNLTSVFYMYSDTYYFYTNTNEFVAKGKEDIETNTKYGYHTLKQRNIQVPDEENPEESITVPTFDGVTFAADKAGYYVLQFTDDSGKHGQTFQISQEDIEDNRPTVAVDGYTITVSDGENEDITVKSINYVCTTEAFGYTNWSDMVAKGKENTAVNGTKGYMTGKVVDNVSNIICKAPGYYTMLIYYTSADVPDNTMTFAKTVEVDEYQTEIVLLLDNAACDAGALVTDKDATDEYRALNHLYVKSATSDYIEMEPVRTGVFTKILTGGEPYDIYYGTEEEKHELGSSITDTDPRIRLDYFSTKLTLTDLDAICVPYALKGETYKVQLDVGERQGKQLPLKVTVRQEGQEINYSYNSNTGVISIPNVNGRITIKAMANKRFNHINVKLNAMGGNIYDATWGNPTNYVYSADDISGESILLPTPMAPANSTTVNFGGWYKDIAYTQKVTSINTDDYTEGQTISLYAKWILSAASKETSSMYYAYKGSVYDIRGVKSKGDYIMTTYDNGGYTNYYYYNNGSAYPYTRNGTSNYGGTNLTFVNTVNQSIFTRLGATPIYYAQVMAEQGSYITVNYIFVNTGNTDVKNLTFGACADVKIASNDKAAINVGKDTNGNYLMMEDGTSYAFRLYTMDANQYWIGGYSRNYCNNGQGFEGNVFNNSSSNSNHYDKKFKLGVDSALAYSFLDQTVPANGAIVKTIKLGVGTMAEMGSKSGANITLIGAGGTWNGEAVKTLTSTNSTRSLAGNEPEREGYRFVEWNTSSDGRGTRYATNASVGSATLYAIWDKIVPPSYTVYNKSVVKSASNNPLSVSKADITLFYDNGQAAIDQASYEVEAATSGTDFNATLKLNTEEVGYCLPNTISVTVGGKNLVEGTDYIYSHGEGSDVADLTIKGAKITGDVTVTAIGIITPVKLPTISIDDYREYELRDTDDIELTLGNMDEVNQKYYYRWYVAPTNVNSEGTATSQASDTLHVSSSTTANAGTYYFYCVVTVTRLDNKQSAKIVSDVVTIHVKKKPITESSIVVERDEDENIVGYHVSSNPGNGAVTYTYYIDEDCTIKTSAVDGAGIEGGMPTKNGEYFIKANIAETDNYLSYETEPETYYVTGLPVVLQEGRNFTILNNDSALSNYKYMYSPDFYEYTTWSKYVAKGKEDIATNGKSGYKGKSGTVEGTDSSLDNTKFSFNKAGYYTFLLTYAGGKTYTTCLLVSEPDLISGVPYVTQEYVNDNYAILVNNNDENLESLKVARYIYTGDTEFTTDKWATFVAKGKENIAANTSSGYRIVKPSRYLKFETVEDVQEIVNASEGEEGAVLSLEGERILLPRAGYYTFWLSFTEMDGTVREKQMTVYAGQDITGLDNVGMNVTYFDTAPTGSISRIDYQYFGETEPEIVTSGIQEFTTEKKVAGNITREEPLTECSFQVDRYGWYLIRVQDTSEVGTKYYKIYIEAEGTDDYKVVLIIDGDLIKAVDSEDDTNLITKIKFADSDTYKKGNTIVAPATGLYDVNVVDAKGYTYTLKANVLTLERSTDVSTTSLEKQINSATTLISGCQLVESTDSVTEPGTYAPNSAADELSAAIEEAREVAEIKESQEIVNAEYKKLVNATNAFKSTMKVIESKLVTVNGNTITVEPSADDYSLKAVIYNVNNKTDKVIEPMAFASWAGISGRPYVKTLTFPEDGKQVLTGVPNGVYTFLASQVERGSTKEYVEYAVVHTGTTEKATATSELNRYIGLANDLLARVKRGADAAGPGESYVPEANYDLVVSALASANEMKSELSDNPDNTLDTYEDIIPELVKLNAAIISAEKKLSTKPLVEPTALVINAEDYQDVVITKSDLVKVKVAYGDYSNWSKFSKAGYVSLPVEEGKADYLDAEYNGIYTALCTYSDGTEVFKTFEITTIEYPFSISQNSGIIRLDLEETEALSIGYQYGELFGVEEGEFLPIALEDETAVYEVPALGNGVHTLYVKTADHMYYQSILVDSCDGPVIVQYNGKLGIFTHGFDYSYVAYKDYDEVGYTDWNQMYTSAQYCGQNQWYSLSAFTSDKYTFCFRTSDSSSSVFKNYEIVR